MAKNVPDKPVRDKDEPKIVPEGRWLWDIFITLNAHRYFGSNGPQPLTVADIGAISQLENLSIAESRWMLEVMTLLDGIFLEESYNKIQREQEKARRKTGGKHRPRR